MASWQFEEVQELLRSGGAQQVVGDQCHYGQETADGRPVKKPTRWLRNSPEILKEIEARCHGRAGGCSRPGGCGFVVTSGKIARAAAVYPFKLCRAILRGCSRQLQADGRLQPGQHGAEAAVEAPDDQRQQSEPVALAMADAKKRRAANETVGPSKFFEDSVTGQPLRDELVRAVRRLELDYFQKKHVWTKCHAAKPSRRFANHGLLFGGLIQTRATTTRQTFAAGSLPEKYAKPARTQSSHRFRRWRVFGRSCRWPRRICLEWRARTGTQPALTGTMCFL